MEDDRIRELEEWVTGDQGLALVYDDCNHPAGWMAIAMPRDATFVVNAPLGYGATKIRALTSLCAEINRRRPPVRESTT